MRMNMKLSDCKHGSIVKVNGSTYRLYRLEELGSDRVLGTMKQFPRLQQVSKRESGWWESHEAYHKMGQWTDECELVDDTCTAVAGEVFDTRRIAGLIVASIPTAVEPRRFTHFNDGVKVSDYHINDMIRRVLEAIKNGAKYWCCSTGDTSVAGFVWTTEIQVVVANNAGRSTLTFPVGQPIEFVPYERPS
jgi:hypothetical protein